MKFFSVDPTTLEPRQIQQLILSIVIPRPIGLISTLSEDEVPNLAPFSYFQAVSSQPPALIFCPNRNSEGDLKHSVINARATGEFVANTVTEEIAESTNLASAEFPEEVSEFAQAGFTPVVSEIVKPYRVAESPVNMECKVIQIVELSDKPLGGTIIVGEIVKIHVRDDVFDEKRTLVDLAEYRPISRLGSNAYGLLHETFNMPRPTFNEEGKLIADSHLRLDR